MSQRATMTVIAVPTTKGLWGPNTGGEVEVTDLLLEQHLELSVKEDVTEWAAVVMREEDVIELRDTLNRWLEGMEEFHAKFGKAE